MRQEEARAQAKQEIIFTVAQLVCWMECSVSVARRQLKKWAVITSYNANARYYALPEVVDFGPHGIWRCEPAAFSAHGNLTNTVVALVRDSVAGLTSCEIGAILGLVPRSFLAPFGKHPQIAREREGNTFVYFCADPQRQQQQRLARMPTHALNDHDAIVVLLCWIEGPGQTIEQLATTVRQRAPSASVESITKFFSLHGLCAGKKRASRSQL